MLPPSTYIIAQIKRRCCYFCVTLMSAFPSVCYYISDTRKHRRLKSIRLQKRKNSKTRLTFTPKNTKGPEIKNFVLGHKNVAQFNQITPQGVYGIRSLSAVWNHHEVMHGIARRASVLTVMRTSLHRRIVAARSRHSLRPSAPCFGRFRGVKNSH